MIAYGRIFVTSHCGIVGSAILRRQQVGRFGNLLFRTHANAAAVVWLLQGESPATHGEVPQ